MPASGTKHLILDSWPVLEWIKGRQPARDKFRRLIEDALSGTVLFSMSRINHGEVIYSIAKDVPPELREKALSAFKEIPIQLYSVSDEMLDQAVQIKSAHSISYADCFAVALALKLQVPVVTGDKEFLKLDRKLGVQLHWVGA